MKSIREFWPEIVVLAAVGAIVAVLTVAANGAEAVRGVERLPATDPATAVRLIESRTIDASGRLRIEQGSGVSVDSAGTIWTVTHVVKGDDIRVRFGDDWTAAEVVRRHPHEALSVIRLKGDGHNIAFAAVASHPPSRGDPCEVIGYPAGTFRRVESTIATTRAKFEDTRHPLTGFTSRVGGGTSGGGVFVGGKLVGLVSVSTPLLSQSGGTSVLTGRGLPVQSDAADSQAYAIPVSGLEPAQAAAKPELWYFGAAWCGPCRAFHRDLERGKWGRIIARSGDGRRIETEQIVVTQFDVDDPKNLTKLRDIQAVLLKATGKRYEESIPAFYVPGRDAMQIGYASATGCWLIDTIKAALVSPSTPIPPRPSLVADAAIELGEPQPYSRLRPIEPTPDPISTPFAPAPSPATEDAESRSIVQRADDALAKAEAAIAKVREIEAAIKGEPKASADGVDGESDTKSLTLAGILSLLAGVGKIIYEWKRGVA